MAHVPSFPKGIPSRPELVPRILDPEPVVSLRGQLRALRGQPAGDGHFFPERGIGSCGPLSFVGTRMCLGVSLTTKSYCYQLDDEPNHGEETELGDNKFLY